MSIKKYYVDCSRLRPDENLNSRNVPIKSYTETAIKGYIGSGSDNIIRVADKDTIETRYKFFCNDFSLAVGDLIKYENKTYEVVGPPRNTAHKNNHIKTTVRQVESIKQQ